MVLKKGLKGRVAMAAASLFIAAGAVTAMAPAADAATVPNRYYCNPSGGWCYQINGAHDPAVQDQCHWKRSGMAGKPQQLYYTSCDSWGQDVP